MQVSKISTLILTFLTVCFSTISSLSFANHTSPTRENDLYILSTTPSSVSSPLPVDTCSLNPPTVSTPVNPLCSGQPLQLFGGWSGIEAVTYAWTGPEFFSSTDQNPTIIKTGMRSAGVYTLTITNAAGCTASATLNVAITQSPPAPDVTINPFLCEGQTLAFTATDVPGASYLWTGPNFFISALHNPTRPNVTLQDEGVYSLTVTLDGCSALRESPYVTVNPRPAIPNVYANQTTLCAGQTLTLTTDAVGVSLYKWSGPNDWGYAGVNPPAIVVTQADAGVYVLRTGIGYCASDSAKITIVVNASLAAPTVSVNPNLACVGQTINLIANAYPDALYTWTGPNGFTSNVQSPTLSNVTTAMNGSYSLTVLSGGCSAATSVTVTAVPIPISPTAISAGSPTTSSLNVIFNESPGVPKYRVGYRIKGANSWVYTSNFGPTFVGGQTVYTLAGLQAGSNYQFIVEGVTPCGSYTESSNIVEGATLSGPLQACMTPNDIFADVTGPTSAVLGFQVDAGTYSCVVISYGLQTQNPALWTNITIPAGGSPNILKTRSISGLLSNRIYSFRLRTNCSASCSASVGTFSAWSPTMTFKTLTARETDGFTTQTAATPHFNLYPNPNRGNFTLSLESETTENRLIEIYDMTGRLILKELYEIISGNNEISFDLTAQPQGVYLLKTESYSAKIIVE